ncbi:MAG TPA: DUF4301 family protein [Bacteroidales bacterium]|nr:DUF4301 family protein [Bacteroidales bacterium]
MFTDKDIKQIENNGMKVADIERQLDYFREGIPNIRLVRPALVGDGIEVVDDENEEKLVNSYEALKTGCRPLKFIPASGAASRMFKDLFEAEAYLRHNEEKAGLYLEGHPLVRSFFDDLEEYPFYFDLKEKARGKHLDFDLMIKEKKYHAILELLLFEEGLNYGNLPKALLKFHAYGQLSRTAFEEHFAETMDYLSDEDEEVRLHFTISPEYRQSFEQLAAELSDVYAEDRGTRINVEFSEQQSDTNTIAVDLNNEPYRNNDGQLVFRPGGHGALLGNLAKVDSAMVFIGNIDNIAPEESRLFKVRYKKLLGGFLLDRVKTSHALLDRLEQGERGDGLRSDVTDFIRQISDQEAAALGNMTNDAFNSKAYDFLNRPVRVCGMVENVGEPGGGPFWVSDKSGNVSRQIVERSQVDTGDYQQDEIIRSSTHFNPVDMVCYINDHKGKPFDLFAFRDPDLGFITKKSINGKDIKALELPGLWNGSMAGWITYFLDMPLSTFTPVKTVFDLLRPEHR